MISRKYILIFLLILNWRGAICQTLNCEVIKKLVNIDYFKKEFLVCEVDSVVIIYDKNKIINECKEFNVCSKIIQINTDAINNLSPEKYSNYKPKNLIILYEYKTEKNKHTISFWRPYSGANATLTYKIKKGKIKLVKHTIGTF